jgi:biotin carboxylase
MSKRILILGAGVMQGPAIRLAKNRHWSAVVVDADPNAPCAGLADRFERIDLKDKEAIEEFARSLRDEGGLDGVMTAGTDFSATVAWVAERLGLPGIPYEVALDASDKARMRERFRAEGVPSPDFLVVSSPPTADSFPFPFPVVVKPVDNMGSRGCRRVDSEQDLAAAVADALGYSRSRRAIIEEYMDGPEFSVDALVFDGEITICGLADRHIFFPPYFIEMGHTIPSAIGPTDAAALLSVFTRGVRALGIRNGAAKGDIKLTANGPMIGEIAARLSGGYMSGWTYPYASGVEPTAGALAIAVGEKPVGLEPTRTWTCAERAFISIPGTVGEIVGVDSARAAPGVQDLFLRAVVADRVRFPENNVSKCGNVIAAAPDRAQAVASAEEAARRVLIRLAPRDPETDAFLHAGPRGPAAFPPDAFALPPDILALLDALPAGSNRLRSGDLALLPFSAFAASAARDRVGRTVAQTLAAVELLTGVALRPRASETAAEDEDGVLGAGFWRALIRGGYQGGAYFIDSRRGSRPR